jgi:AraC-like DNA-binding protein
MEMAPQVLGWMTTALVAACLALLWRDGRQERYAPYLAAFLVGIVCYVFAGPLIAARGPYPVWVHAVVIGRGAAPIAYWLLSQCLFDDGFRFRRWHALVAAAQLTVRHLAFLGLKSPDAVPWMGRRLTVVLVAIVVAGVWLLVADVMRRVLRQADDDLVESRVRLRHLWVRAAAVCIVIAVVVSAATAAFGESWAWALVDAVVVLAFTFAFALSQMRLDLGLPGNRAVADVPVGLAERLEELMVKEQVFRTPGLTIGRLAERLGQPEHKARALINTQLGFRNFSAFLNTYRIREADRLLGDAANDHLTVSEIAFALGYQSLGPFNRAFKEAKGQTPTERRKASRA